ncbi:MAG: Asp-tRNA(Asn)/Glu-tRNA(Gln) amidotransferase subunit GatC [Acidimicrobiales bacterium]
MKGTEATPPGRIAREDVAHVAHLARLELSEGELVAFTDQLASVLEYAAQVEKADVDGLEPMSHPLELHDVLRDDLPAASLDRGEVLSQAPAHEDGRFKVPRLLSEEP